MPRIDDEILQRTIPAEVDAGVTTVLNHFTKMHAGHWAYRGICRRSDDIVPELFAALKQAVEDGCATVYAHEHDEAGVMGCCGEPTYRPHAEGCWMVRARAVIAKVEGGAA